MAIIYDIKDELTVSDSCLCFLTPNATVLEFGSATGYATRYMIEKYNCTVTCIEKIPEMAEVGRKIAHKMIVADIEADEWENQLENTYDFIIFADVLEHLLNPEKVIARVIRFLNADGFIVTSIPNIGHNAIIMNLRNGKFRYTETGLLDNTHIHFFTREGIFEMFYKNGLHCKAEENKVIRPCDTELETYYIQNPLLALSLIQKKDAHVYRYVQKWSMNEPEKADLLNVEKRMSISKMVLELGYDLACFVKRKFNFKTPKIITSVVQKPLENKEKKRYEKYNS
ncbi:MAG TPA: class I SAM-dependent methyltransferase [Paludibacter sp.]|nr:class I SAM-dependent methyltransferase [Paludibacter sp.]